jgi:LuxR family quorum sensing-dependent transcriptional regulator
MKSIIPTTRSRDAFYGIIRADVSKEGRNIRIATADAPTRSRSGEEQWSRPPISPSRAAAMFSGRSLSRVEGVEPPSLVDLSDGHEGWGIYNSQLAFEAIDGLEELETPEQVMNCLRPVMGAFGFSGFLITGVPQPPARVEPHYLLDGLPEGFTQEYTSKNYYPDDPIAAWCRRTVNPFEWSKARYSPDVQPRAREVMNLAAVFGMREGFCVPIRRAKDIHDCVSMAGDQPNLEPKAKHALHFLSLYAHAKILDILEPAVELRTSQNILSLREREVLQWVSAGKSSWDVSVILGISEHTINWLITRAARKLNAVNRTHAVVNAIRAGEIHV